MNTKIKLTSLLLALSLTLAACSNDEETTNNENTEDNSTEQTETTNESNDSNEDSNDDDSDDNNSSETNNENTSNESNTNDELDMSQFDTSIEDAIEEAKSNFDGELTDIGVSTENNQYVYKIELESDTEEYEVSLDVNDLSVVEEETEKEDDSEDNDYFQYNDLVKVEDAIETAKKEVDGKVEEWSTDFEDGKLYYEISIIQNSDNEDVDVIIDAYTGDFVKIDD
ncbi:PepSY domain-containing protein [Nosocomiicoccus ampullae]|uniref:PepSY domain-containing protein n=1 Tax=Nosocomiicoccus ampullae TaxID=489910 RepID=UPI001C5D3D69|nr:PepSY domain-containing protein [Nosocomiicoccus ampullae]QYA48579.1 PepSY domain-containing protein [Nosocomiicoccus ampullae]